MTERATKLVFRFLDTNGNGTGTKNAIGNYSSPGQDFYYTDPTNFSLIARMIVNIEDTTGMQVNEYGNLGSVLTNGIGIEVQNSSQEVILDLCDGEPIKNNGDWGKFCYDAEVKTWGAGNERLQARWTFTRAGSPVILEPGWRFNIFLNDDLTGLVNHNFIIQGFTRGPNFTYRDDD